MSSDDYETFFPSLIDAKTFFSKQCSMASTASNKQQSNVLGHNTLFKQKTNVLRPNALGTYWKTKNNLQKSSEFILKLVQSAIEKLAHTGLAHKYACDIHILLFLANTYGTILFHYFNVVFSVPINILNKHGLEHITFNTTNGLDNKIECGLLCAFNDECDFFLYQGRDCYLASYNTTGRGLFGDTIDSSEIACYQNSSKIISFKLFFIQNWNK